MIDYQSISNSFQKEKTNLQQTNLQQTVIEPGHPSHNGMIFLEVISKLVSLSIYYNT